MSKPDKAGRIALTKSFGYRALAISIFLILVLALHNYAQAHTRRKRRRPSPSPSSSSSSSSNNRDSASRGAEVARYTTIVFVLAAIMVYLLFNQTYHDPTFVVKRMGRVAVALLPATYLLTLRPSPFPETLYLLVVPIHKWLARFIVALVMAHASLYIYIYGTGGKLFELWESQNLAGIGAITCFLAMAVSSLRPLRHRFYAVFYTLHYSLAWLSLGLIWYHSRPPSNEYVGLCVALMVYQAGYRLLHTRHVSLPVQYISPTLLMISIPRDQLPFQDRLRFSPGAHVRLSEPLYTPSGWLGSTHPYTIASLPHEPHLQLIIRKSRYPIKLRKIYALFGPFDSLPTFIVRDALYGRMKRALFVIGGSGIAFAAPVMRYLHHNGVSVKLLWTTRDIREIAVLQQLGLSHYLESGQIEVYVSSIQEAAMGLDRSESGTLNDDEALTISLDDKYCFGPVDERTRLISGKMLTDYATSSAASHLDSRFVYSGRVNLNMRIKSWLSGLAVNNDACYCVDELIQADPDQMAASWVIASGNRGLVRDAKRWAQTNRFNFYKEEFSV